MTPLVASNGLCGDQTTTYVKSSLITILSPKRWQQVSRPCTHPVGTGIVGSVSQRAQIGFASGVVDVSIADACAGCPSTKEIQPAAPVLF